MEPTIDPPFGQTPNATSKGQKTVEGSDFQIASTSSKRLASVSASGERTSIDNNLDQLEMLYREHSSDLLNLAWLLVNDKELAKELLHDVFVSVAKSINRVDNPVSYVRTALILRCRKHYRSKASESSKILRFTSHYKSQDSHESNFGIPDFSLIRSESHRELMNALSRLPDRQREVLLLRYFTELTEQQTAASINISVGAVKSHASRGINSLRAALTQVSDKHDSDKQVADNQDSVKLDSDKHDSDNKGKD